MQGRTFQEVGKAYAKSQKWSNSVLGQTNPTVVTAEAEGAEGCAADGHAMGEGLVEVFACHPLEIRLL